MIRKKHNLQLASRVENSRNAEILYIVEQAREARMLTSVMLSPICPYFLMYLYMYIGGQQYWSSLVVWPPMDWGLCQKGGGGEGG